MSVATNWLPAPLSALITCITALISAITKTGGNHFHGSAFIEFQPKSFIGQPFFDKQNHVPKPPYSRKQFGGELSGPIIPGRLTFYVGGEGTIEKLPATTGNVQGPFPVSLLSQVNIPHNFDFKQGLYFGKLTFFDGYTYTWWNWIIVVPINGFLAEIWPIYWLLLRPLMGS